MSDILILVGTESGTAQMVAECLQEDLEKAGHAVDVVDDMSGTDPALATSDIVLVCTATHGMGELPANILPFADTLEEAKPDLSHVRYGIIALGDQTYQDTFCFGGHAYDGLQIAVAAMVRAGSTDKAKVCDEIEKTAGYIGTGGIVHMSAKDHLGLNLSAFRMLEIRNGDWTIVD